MLPSPANKPATGNENKTQAPNPVLCSRCQSKNIPDCDATLTHACKSCTLAKIACPRLSSRLHPRKSSKAGFSPLFSGYMAPQSEDSGGRSGGGGGGGGEGEGQSGSGCDVHATVAAAVEGGELGLDYSDRMKLKEEEKRKEKRREEMEEQDKKEVKGPWKHCLPDVPASQRFTRKRSRSPVVKLT